MAHSWEEPDAVFPGIPSEDIVWQNVGKLMQSSTVTRVKCFLKPILISVGAIFCI